MGNTDQLTININAYVKVKLTDAGKERWTRNQLGYREQNRVLGSDRVEQLYPLEFPLDSDGFYRTQLWMLFQDFPPEPPFPGWFVDGLLMFDVQDSDVAITGRAQEVG